MNPVWNEAKDVRLASLLVARAVAHRARRVPQPLRVRAQGGVRRGDWRNSPQQPPALPLLITGGRRTHDAGHGRRRARDAPALRKPRSVPAQALRRGSTTFPPARSAALGGARLDRAGPRQIRDPRRALAERAHLGRRRSERGGDAYPSQQGVFIIPAASPGRIHAAGVFLGQPGRARPRHSCSGAPTSTSPCRSAKGRATRREAPKRERRRSRHAALAFLVRRDGRRPRARRSFALFLSTSMYDRASVRAMGEALAGDSQVVASYLRDDARKRSICAHRARARRRHSHAPRQVERLAREDSRRLQGQGEDRAEASSSTPSPPSRSSTPSSRSIRRGAWSRQVGFDQASGIENFELGGYPVVADALHGWVRDDSWVLGGRIYRVVGRPVENDVSQMPAGAIVGVRILDDSFARELSKRTGRGDRLLRQRRARLLGRARGLRHRAARHDHQRSEGARGDPNLQGQGVQRRPHAPRRPRRGLRAARRRSVGPRRRLRGRAHGASHRLAARLFATTPTTRTSSAVPLHDDRPRRLILVARRRARRSPSSSTRGRSTYFASRPSDSARGNTDQLTPSKFRGVYRQIASNLNDGMEKVAAKGGAPRRAADLDAVLGPMPAQPSMSAFSLPQDGAVRSRRARRRAPPAAPAARRRFRRSAAALRARPPSPTPKPRSPGAGAAGGLSAPAAAAPAAEPSDLRCRAAKPPRPSTSLRPPPHSPPRHRRAGDAGPTPLPKPIPPTGRPARRPIRSVRRGVGSPPPLPAADDDDEATVVSQVPNEILGSSPADRDTGRPPAIEDEAAEWKRVFEEFVRLKKECGEPTDGAQLREIQEHAAQKPRPAAPAPRLQVGPIQRLRQGWQSGAQSQPRAHGS